jgi:hypothetical protein
MKRDLFVGDATDRKDPEQLVNVAADPAYAKTLARLRAELAAWQRATTDPRASQDDNRWEHVSVLRDAGEGGAVGSTIAILTAGGTLSGIAQAGVHGVRGEIARLRSARPGLASALKTERLAVSRLHAEDDLQHRGAVPHID